MPTSMLSLTPSGGTMYTTIVPDFVISIGSSIRCLIDSFVSFDSQIMKINQQNDEQLDKLNELGNDNAVSFAALRDIEQEWNAIKTSIQKSTDDKCTKDDEIMVDDETVSIYSSAETSISSQSTYMDTLEVIPNTQLCASQQCKVQCAEHEIPECGICSYEYDIDIDQFDKHTNRMREVSSLQFPIRIPMFAVLTSCNDSRSRELSACATSHRRHPVSCTACGETICYACIMKMKENYFNEEEESDDDEDDRVRLNILPRYCSNDSYEEDDDDDDENDDDDEDRTNKSSQDSWLSQEEYFYSRFVQCPYCRYPTGFDTENPFYNRSLCRLVKEQRSTILHNACHVRRTEAVTGKFYLM